MRRTKLTGLILEQLRQYVLTNGFSADDRLPPERELAARLSVSRPSLRNALNWLSERGALRRVQGGGTFLRENFLAVLAESRENDQSVTRTMLEVIEARVCLEPLLVRMAADRLDEERLQSLEAEVRRGAECVDDADAWCQHDLKFHAMLAHLSGNSILAEVLESLFTDVISLWRTHFDQLDRQQMHADHMAILADLSRHEGESAARRMQQHLEAFQRLTKSRQLRVVSA